MRVARASHWDCKDVECQGLRIWTQVGDGPVESGVPGYAGGPRPGLDAGRSCVTPGYVADMQAGPSESWWRGARASLPSRTCWRVRPGGGSLVHHSWAKGSGCSRLQVRGPRQWRTVWVRHAEIRGRARAQCGAPRRHSRRAVRWRARLGGGALVRHSRSVQRRTIKASSSVPEAVGLRPEKTR